MAGVNPKLKPPDGVLAATEEELMPKEKLLVILVGALLPSAGKPPKEKGTLGVVDDPVVAELAVLPPKLNPLG